MEPTVSSETSEIRTQTPGNYPKRNKLHTVSLSAVSRAFKLYEFKYIYIYIRTYNGCIIWEGVRRNEERREERNKEKTEDRKRSKINKEKYK